MKHCLNLTKHSLNSTDNTADAVDAMPNTKMQAVTNCINLYWDSLAILSASEAFHHFTSPTCFV